MGTAAYMSPEQIRGEPLDCRTDLFSFGLVLYEMKTGRQAFEQSTVEAIRGAVLNELPTPARRLNPKTPLKLADFGLRLMARASLFHGMTRVYQELLSVRRDANEMYLVPVPAQLVGMDFVAAANVFLPDREDGRWLRLSERFSDLIPRQGMSCRRQRTRVMQSKSAQTLISQWVVPMTDLLQIAVWEMKRLTASCCSHAADSESDVDEAGLLGNSAFCQPSNLPFAVGSRTGAVFRRSSLSVCSPVPFN